jgi:hypothetical protein
MEEADKSSGNLLWRVGELENDLADAYVELGQLKRDLAVVCESVMFLLADKEKECENE